MSMSRAARRTSAVTSLVDLGGRGGAVQVLAQAVGTGRATGRAGPWPRSAAPGRPVLIPARAARISAATAVNWSIMSALVGAQRGGGPDQVAEPLDRRRGPGRVVLGGEPGRHGAQLAVQDRPAPPAPARTPGSARPVRRDCQRRLQAVQDERLLGGEVVEDRLLRHPARLGDLGHPDRVEASFQEHRGRGVGQLLAHQPLLALAQPLSPAPGRGVRGSPVLPSGCSYPSPYYSSLEIFLLH